jgi:hypothetical protein
MTHLKQREVVAERLQMGPVVPCGQKKSPLGGGLQTIFLEENSGDRCNYVAAPDMCPISFLDTSHHVQ